MKLLHVKPVDPATRGAESTLGKGMDFALVVAVFLGIGALIDHWLGTWPAFGIGLVIFAIVGQFIKMYYDYTATMQRLEAERAAGRRAQERAA